MEIDELGRRVNSCRFLAQEFLINCGDIVSTSQPSKKRVSESSFLSHDHDRDRYDERTPDVSGIGRESNYAARTDDTVIAHLERIGETRHQRRRVGSSSSDDPRYLWDTIK